METNMLRRIFFDEHKHWDNHERFLIGAKGGFVPHAPVEKQKSGAV
jgi:cupin superfamily acireductone dioxygenase involved in methionine salvage